MLNWSRETKGSVAALIFGGVLAFNLIAALETGTIHSIKGKHSEKEDRPFIHEIERADHPQRFWVGFAFYGLIGGFALWSSVPPLYRTWRERREA